MFLVLVIEFQPIGIANAVPQELGGEVLLEREMDEGIAVTSGGVLPARQKQTTAPPSVF